ncbi:MAG: nucleoside triphosphate pyrophosphohydrolase [Bacteroidetes bacterium]|nr:nucleoside triphosphate pyrophosphohydrolase [Bacteroidota bacterium]
MTEKGIAFEKLLAIMDELREKCPWDKKQTMESLRHLTIEETYELADSILNENRTEIKKELGDLLLHIVFYAKIADEQNSFDIKNVIDSLCEKLIHRHPHIYGDVKVNDEEDVKRNWEQLKLKEGKTSVLEGVPLALPAMVKASRIQDKAKGAGFDWEKSEQVWEKVEEEISEFRSEVESTNPSKEKIESEFGDVLFSLINYARFLDINPEDALEKTNKKFIRRFQYIEAEAAKAGKSLHDMTLAEMDVYWNEAKKL